MAAACAGVWTDHLVKFSTAPSADQLVDQPDGTSRISDSADVISFIDTEQNALRRSVADFHVSSKPDAPLNDSQRRQLALKRERAMLMRNLKQKLGVSEVDEQVGVTIATLDKLLGIPQDAQRVTPS